MGNRIEFEHITNGGALPTTAATGLPAAAYVYRNLPAPALLEHVARRNEGFLTQHGALVVYTGRHTGRSPDDKFIVQEPATESDVWWGKVNRPFPQDRFNALYERMKIHMAGRDLYVQECRAGADPRYQISLRVITEYAWHSLFAQHLFLGARPAEMAASEPELTVIDLPTFKADPGRDGTRSETFVLLDLSQRLILIGGTEYAGEIKKSVFSVMNYVLPRRSVMSMHSSANVGSLGDSAIFFGLSGTGKTTLSADPTRSLIGDDETGWSDEGVFNIEGGCYAKVIRLDPHAEPEIYACTQMFGTVLENVIIDPGTRSIDLDSDVLTENTRAAYPLSYIPNAVPSHRGGHPRNIIMLTADAFGVMPPVARLTPEQAMYHFISGYTAKLAGTERGLGKEPQATFSACFGAPFMVRHPSVYASLLRDQIAAHGVKCWLVNTGWTGGPYGVGARMEIRFTRAIVRAILEGSLAEIAVRPDPVFGLWIPESCPGVPSDVLTPRKTWKSGQSYDEKAKELAHRFITNFEQYSTAVDPQVMEASPITP